MSNHAHPIVPMEEDLTHGSTAALGAANAGAAFPPLPPLPPSGCPDPTLDPNWPPQDDAGNYLYNTFADDGIMQTIAKALTYIDSHPGDPTGTIVLAKIFFRLSSLPPSVLTTVENKLKAEGISLDNISRLLGDGFYAASQFGFLYGYNGGTGGTINDFEGFAKQVEAAFGGTPPADPLLNAIWQAANYVTSYAFTYIQSTSEGHIAKYLVPPPTVDAFGNPIAPDDSVFVFKENYTNPDGTISQVRVYYDWTAARNAENTKPTPPWAITTLQRIESSIENSDGATGGPNPNIDTLDKELSGLQIGDSLDTFFTILRMTGDVGMAILAFMYEWEGYNMSSGLSGPADVMDKEKRLSQWAKQIEDDLKGMGAGLTPDQAMDLVGQTLSLFDTINQSGQLVNGLGSAVASAISSFQSVNIIWPPGNTASPPTTASAWTLFVNAASGGSVAGTLVSPKNLRDALQDTLFPSPPDVPSGEAPAANPDSGSVALQGMLGGFDGIITAVSSNSTAEVTSSQQMESLINAMDKVMTGVTDKTTGMNNAVILKTLTLPS